MPADAKTVRFGGESRGVLYTMLPTGDAREGGYIIYFGSSGPEIFDWEPNEPDDENPATYTSYFQDVDENVLKDLDWLDEDDWKSVLRSGGYEGMQDMEDVRRAATSSDPVERASVYELVAGHWGWHELDHYPNTHTAKEMHEMLPELFDPPAVWCLVRYTNTSADDWSETHYGVYQADDEKEAWEKFRDGMKHDRFDVWSEEAENSGSSSESIGDDGWDVVWVDYDAYSEEELAEMEEKGVEPESSIELVQLDDIEIFESKAALDEYVDSRNITVDWELDD